MPFVKHGYHTLKSKQIWGHCFDVSVTTTWRTKDNIITQLWTVLIWIGKATLRTIFHLCIFNKNLAKPHF
jgi:hypothetical protein